MTEPDAIPWPLVLAVVVTRNGRRWLPACLKSLALQSYPALKVVVVDNASEDRDLVPGLVERLLPDASVMHFSRNVGFGAAANRVLEVSPDARRAEYYLFLHDDVALDQDCVGLLVASALETEAGVVGGKGLSWDEPEVLLEVGMSADEFGYPVSGLEEGEIDQGQHDVRRDVLFVTSACILVSRATVERGGSWDPAYFLFGEDLDLCIRARMLGFPVVVAPKAYFYHAMAMATGRRERPPAQSIRYFTRRNRLRTIAKNTSTTRVLLLVALYTGVLGAEMVLLAALRRFSEIPPYLRAYAWFLKTVPDVARRRRAIQRRRKISDRRVRRYMVRDLPRARIFLERRLMQWGEETVRLGAKTFANLTPGAIASRLGRWARSPSALASLLISLVLVLAARHVLLGPPVGAGSLWPFPVETHRLLTDYFARWREIGLGTTGAPSPALPLFWLVGIAAFGNAALAQKLLVGLLLALGLFGINRFVKRRTTFIPARIVAVAIYALAPVMRLTMVTGDLGALALYAAAPYLLEMALRMLGPAPGAAPPGAPGGGVRPAVPASSDALARQAMRLALLSALVVALAPSALVAIVALWLVAGFRALRERPSSGEAPRRLAWLLGSSVVAAVVLVPWSLEALHPHGAILGPLFAGAGGGNALRPLWSPVSFAHALLVAPGVSALAGLAAIAIVVGSLLVVSTSRRREVRVLASVIVVFGLWAGLVAKGWLPAPVASPALWLVVPLVALAACAGYLLAGLAQDLPRHAAGLRHTAGAGAAILSAAAVLGGWVPTLASWSAPPASAVTGTGPESAALAAVQGSAATSDSQFRVLWLGQHFVDPLRTDLRPERAVPYVVTGPDGLSLLDTAPPGGGPAGAWLSSGVDALLAGRTHLAGHLLATAGIRFVIVDHADAATMQAVIIQQDLALQQQLAQADIYTNLGSLPIAALAPPPLEAAVASGSSDPEAVLRAQWPPVPAESGLGRRSLGSFSGHVTAAIPSRSLVLGEVYSPGWNATIGVESLQHGEAFGWANRFTVPPGASGTVRISYAGEWIRIAWVVGGGALIALALAMAFAARMPKADGKQPPPLLDVKAERPLARVPSSRVRVVAPTPRAPAPDAPRPRRERR
jgi:GT2 family glycosyltransferase